MPIPDYETLMLPVLRLFASGTTRVRDCIPEIVRQFDITPEEAEQLIPSGSLSVVASRTHWARTYLSKAGLLESPRRNHHLITERGRTVLASNPARIDNAFLVQFSEFGDWRRRSANEVESAGETPTDVLVTPSLSPDETLDRTIHEINTALAAELQSELANLSPQRFERLILDLLLRMGYGRGLVGAGKLTQNSADGGIDWIIFEDALGLDAVFLQAKRYALGNNVGRPDIQRFIGALTGEGASKGVFVTTSQFSREAREFLNRVQQRVTLIDGTRLAALMIEHEVGVRARKTYVRRSIDEDYFAESE